MTSAQRKVITLLGSKGREGKACNQSTAAPALERAEQAGGVVESDRRGRE